MRFHLLAAIVVACAAAALGLSPAQPAAADGGSCLAHHPASLELLSSPAALVQNSNPNGSFIVKYAPNTFTVCSPVWSIVKKGEPAAFHAMLTEGSSTSPLVMHAGDTVTVHWFTTAAADG